MKLRVLSAVALLLVASSAAYSQGPAGMWKGQQAGRGGGPAQEITLDIAVEGNNVTGTWMQGDQSAEISDGMIEEGMVKFKRTISFEGRGGGGPQEIMLNYTGEIVGDQMTLTIEVEGVGGRGGGGRGGPAPLVLTRQ